MYKRILIPTDGTALSKKAIDHGLALAKAVNARVTTVTVSRPYSTLVIEPDTIIETPEDYKQRIASNAAKHLAVARDAARVSGVNVTISDRHYARPKAGSNRRRTEATPKGSGCDIS